MPFQKGESGNPGGRPKSNFRTLLEAALFSVGKKHKTTPMKALAEAFYKDHSVMLGVLKCLVPSLKQVEAKITEESPFRLIIDLSGKDKSLYSDTKPKKAQKKSC